MLVAIKPLPILLVVTRDKGLAYELTHRIKPYGYQVEYTEDAEEMLEMLPHLQPEYILLDWGSTASESMQLCHRIRLAVGGGFIYILALCEKNNARDRVQALGAGVNDYLTKPLTAQNLLGSMEALQRQRVVVPFFRELKAGEISMALDQRIVYVSGKVVDLTHKEFRLLEELLTERGRALTREALLAKIWQHTNVDKIHTRTVDIHISRLRQKLGYSGQYIITVRNVGYRFDIAPEWINYLERPVNSS